MAFVRKSKFRHVFGQASRKESCYEGFRVTNCAFEGTFIAANEKFIAFCVEVGGGGAFVVLPVEKKGRLDVNLPKVSAHKEYVLDLQWNPFDDNMIASCSEDGSIKIWNIPEHGIMTNWDGDKALLTLDYHERRCIQIAWHPVAANVLLSVSQEPKICIWNLDDGVAELEIEGHPDIIYNAAWSMKGDKIVTSCKDRKFRIFNARTGGLILESGGHEGSKPQRVIWTMDDKYLFSCGFSRMSERQYCSWRADDMSELNLVELDTANGCLIPYYDPDTQIVYIAAKGDSVIRYYELVDEEPYFHYITTFQSSAAQRGLAPIPKRSLNVNECEVYRFYKLRGDKAGIVEPVQFTVPRKSDIYQDDLYPDAVSDVPAIEASEFFEGKDAIPNRISMSTRFIGKAKPKKAAAGGGGLKKAAGLKGLKAKKDKENKDAPPPPESSPQEDAPKEVASQESAREEERAPESVKPSELRKEKEVASASPALARGAPQDSGPSVNPKLVDDLLAEVKALKAKDKKREQEVKTLVDRLHDYDKHIGDIKLLCDAVKKNDERIAALEALVQEESEDEEN